MKNISFSIIVPVYGVEKYIRKCADTILGQTYEHIQFIFVNDGTKDKSMQFLEELIDEKYQYLRERIIIVNKENEGLPAARKSGLDYAEGDYILHVDADDWLERTAVQTIADKAGETSADIICFRFYKEETKRVKNRGDLKYSIEQKDEFLRDLITHRAYGYVWNKCCRRELYDRSKAVFAKYGMFEDVFLMPQLVYHAESIAHIDTPLYHYRRTNIGSISRQKRANKRLYSSMNMLDLYELFKDNLKDSPIKESYGRILYHAAWCSLFYGLGLFEKYPYLAQTLRAVGVGRSNHLSILQQIIVRLAVSTGILR